ncbi:uncharacterized protein BDR25DRAFT_235768 [Lindgomyces ingoldianus]|uniref:Uncharacterized protein n=1 Tax=Lindgomyces ingoldianus TaxID=673940 RepID=A0ACB6QK25_9PLEO|nr:uncharacterized protein BDR25DRAFT_235768 [Lindgomyces ingoldianus]KAF2466870.1 hypothetical protein BDR25DRAFT_235768 [Lindgomyces ingoldianus]
MKKPEFKMPSIKLPSVKVSELKHHLPSFKRQPVFNRPVQTSGHRTISRALYLTLLCLLVAFSTAVIALKAMTLEFIEDNSDTGFVFETGDPDPTILAALPRMLFEAPAKLAIVAAVVSIFIGFGHGAFIVKDWKVGAKTQTYSFRRNTMFLHLTNSILILLSMVAIYVTHKSTSHFSERYINRKADRPGDGVRYNIGTFDLETWSCELQSVKGAEMVWEDYGRQCKVEMAGRAVMIPFLVVGFVLAAVGVAGMVGGRGEEAELTWNKQGDRRLDGGEDGTGIGSVEMGKLNDI